MDGYFAAAVFTGSKTPPKIRTMHTTHNNQQSTIRREDISCSSLSRTFSESAENETTPIPKALIT
jgi:hypothetical protein